MQLQGEICHPIKQLVPDFSALQTWNTVQIERMQRMAAPVKLQYDA
jgi:hypothetical protein